LSTYKDAVETKVLWRGKKRETVTINIGQKEMVVGWDHKKEAPKKVIEYDPDKNGVELYVNGKHVASVILVTGSATFYNVHHIQRLRNAIQLFIGIPLNI